MRTLSAVRETVQQVLRDEFQNGITPDFSPDEIDIHIGLCVEEISQHSPNIVREVLTTIADSKELDISSIDNLIAIDRAEYPTGEDPKSYHNVIRIDNETVEIDTDSTPIAGASGTLTGIVTFLSGSTAVTGLATLFTSELEAGYHIRKSTGTRWYRIASITDATHLVLAEVCRAGDTGVDVISVTQYCYETVYLYCDKLHELTESSSTLKAGEEKVLIDGSIAYTALAWIGSIRGHIREAVTLLTSSENAINSISDRIQQAIADLVAGRPQIDDTRAAADAALDSISDRITQAITDLTTGRPQIDDVKAAADTAIDNMVARITQAIDNLALGQTYINKVNYGGAPENDYANYAARELANANTYLNQARGYLSEGATSDRHGAYAARELANANTLLNQARGYLGEGITSDRYGAYAARELANASSYLNQAGGYIRQASSRLSIAGAINTYQTWANNKLALYKRALLKIERQKVWREYPKE